MKTSAVIPKTKRAKYRCPIFCFIQKKAKPRVKIAANLANRSAWEASPISFRFTPSPCKRA